MGNFEWGGRIFVLILSLARTGRERYTSLTGLANEYRITLLPSNNIEK